MSEIAHRIIVDLLEARTGQQITEDRRWRVATALSGVFRRHGISCPDELVCLLAESASDDLATEVVEALLNNETYFFRDRPMFDRIAAQVLPDLASRRAGTKRLNILSAGCSTGQEAYSLAMLFLSRPHEWRGWTIDITGTDISQSAIEYARRGTYTQFEVQRGLSAAETIGFFEETGKGWTAVPDLRSSVRFTKANLLDPVLRPHRYDLVLCRNVLLYFDAARRQVALDRIAERVARDGWVMLGAGEKPAGSDAALVGIPGSGGLFRPGDDSEPVRQARAASR
ncbi:protein-glutamate O-methyltransferase CheR [Qipengyuania sp. JC766]|uniref:CheR family methyltransferase n=1 Tax=Qipengyuania sp. JC766 TaxID=3232139 RepID=UPI003458B779